MVVQAQETMALFGLIARAESDNFETISRDGTSGQVQLPGVNRVFLF
jgi:hypothetical protein